MEGARDSTKQWLVTADTTSHILGQIVSVILLVTNELASPTETVLFFVCLFVVVAF